MAKVQAYLMFNGNCKEAMTFYKECFGGKLDILPYQGSQMDGGEGMNPDAVMHSHLESGTIVLMGADSMNNDIVTGNNVSLCLICDSKEELNDLFKKLSVGGKVGHEPKEEFFGTYADLTDRYKFNWMFQFGGNSAM
jgi:PhnB protein